MKEGENLDFGLENEWDIGGLERRRTTSGCHAKRKEKVGRGLYAAGERTEERELAESQPLEQRQYSILTRILVLLECTSTARPFISCNCTTMLLTPDIVVFVSRFKQLP